jgi:hypothetical protein
MKEVGKYLKIVDIECWKCGRPMKTALVLDNGCYRGPEEFNELEISLAKQNGVILQNQFSKTSNESYLASTCKECGNFKGKFFHHHFLYENGKVINLD